MFVFSSLLSSRTFAASNFAIDALNRPPATDNFRTLVTVEQPLFDRAAFVTLRSARIGEVAARGVRFLAVRAINANAVLVHIGTA